MILPLSSRPARGAWVEMYTQPSLDWFETSRAPQGARGLKSTVILRLCLVKQSRPARGAWVEILPMRICKISFYMSRPARGAWVEIM